MTGDFFAALARRAIAPPAVRPRLASRFEGDASAALHEAPDHEAAAVPAREPAPPLREARSAAPVAVDVDVQPPAKPFVEPSAAATRLEPVPPLLGKVAALDDRREAAPREASRPRSIPASEVQATAPARPSAPLLPSSPKPAAVPAVARPAVIERTVHERVERQQMNTLRTAIEARVVERLVIEPARVPSAPVSTSAQARPQVDAPGALRVDIHIGRIEVMPASALPADAPRADAPQPPRPQSLDAYLAGRRRP